jgi:hypothetical protein
VTTKVYPSFRLMLHLKLSVLRFARGAAAEFFDGAFGHKNKIADRGASWVKIC